jgi:hypothetical protein
VPKGLEPARARAIWREIVGSKPYFLAADVPLLRQFCCLAARAELIEGMLAATPVQSPEAPRLERRLTSVAASLTNLAVKLRLTTNFRVERHSAARSAEVKSWAKPWNSNGLIGGHAFRRPGRQ